MDRSRTPSRVNYQRMKSLNSIIRSPEKSDSAKRRCTDVACSIFLVGCIFALASSYCNSQHGDPKRLTHGFDFRGRLCGVDIADAPYLMWCTPRGHSRVNWADPICVEHCPSGQYLPDVLCPLPKTSNTSETNGTRIWTMSQEVVLSPTNGTRTLLTYCIPEITEREDATIITNLLESSALGQIKHRVEELVERWRVILFSATLALGYAYTYLFLLHMLARPIMYASCMLVLGVSICCMIFSAYISLPALVQSDTINWPWEQSFTDGWDAILSMLQAKSGLLKENLPFAVHDFSLEALVRPITGAYTAHAFFLVGVASSLLCCALYSLLTRSKHTIQLGIGCVEQACSVLWSLEALLALPFLQFLAWACLSATFFLLFVPMLSAITVTPDLSVVGGRSFHPSLEEVCYLSLWVFVYFWVQEIVHVVCQFMATYAAVRWFLAPYSGIKEIPYFVVPKGLVIAFVYHLGTIALVALVAVVMRPIRWLCFLAGCASNRGLLAYVTHSMDCFLLACEALMHFVSPHIVTELTLSGTESFCACSSNVRRILDANASSAAMLRSTQWLFTLVGTLSISAATALTTIIAIHTPLPFIPEIDGADTHLFAFVGAILGASIGYAFMTLVNRISETVMYCYLSYKEDAERMSNTPKSLERLMTQDL